MSDAAPQEPLTLTPEQQAKLNHLVEREMDEAYYTGLYMKAKDARACLREFAVEVLEELGVPVEAREDAAELRAAAKEAVEAFWNTTPSTADALETGAALRKAVINLSAALAATEGSGNEGVDVERCVCCGQQFDANHLDHDTLTCQNCISAALDLYHSQGEAAELRAAIKRFVDTMAPDRPAYTIHEKPERSVAYREWRESLDDLRRLAEGEKP